MESNMPNLTIKNDTTEYLASSQYIDWKTPAILDKANEFKNMAQDEIHLIKMIYEYLLQPLRYN